MDRIGKAADLKSAGLRARAGSSPAPSALGGGRTGGRAAEGGGLLSLCPAQSGAVGSNPTPSASPFYRSHRLIEKSRIPFHLSRGDSKPSPSRTAEIRRGAAHNCRHPSPAVVRPHPLHPYHFRTGGSYRFSRNLQYVEDILLTAGVALFSASIQATLIAPAIILWFLLASLWRSPISGNASTGRMKNT